MILIDLGYEGLPDLMVAEDTNTRSTEDAGWLK